MITDVCVCSGYIIIDSFDKIAFHDRYRKKKTNGNLVESKSKRLKSQFICYSFRLNMNMNTKSHLQGDP